jgi:site-specific DNA-methyltransferase (adenine-specific)
MFRGDRMRKPSEKYFNSNVPYLEFEGDNRDQRSFYLWCREWLPLVKQAMAQSAPFAIFTDWRQLPTLTDAIQVSGLLWLGVFVWDKTNAARPQKGKYTAQCEYVVWGSNGPFAPATDTYPAGLFRQSVFAEKRMHMTSKPIALLEHLLTICKPGGLVLDPFIGSGSTAVACKRTGRHYIGMEIVPGNIPIIEQRIANVPAPLFSFEEATS